MRVVESRAASLSLLAVALFLFACDRSDQQIKVYRVSKAPLETMPSADAAMPTNASLPSFLPLSAPMAAIIPPNWEPQPLSQMRQASFLVHGEKNTVADISFVTLGPSAGNILDNVNRWLAQLAQPPITADKLASTIQQLPTARGDIAIVDITGEPENGDSSKDGRIIGAIASDEGQIAFFKMRGNSALVGAQKEDFLKWVSSSRGVNATASAPEAAPPANSDKPQIKWEVPQGWSPAPTSAMRYASFTSETNGEKADISVVTFAGDGGSDADNVNRWRQQIGLPAVEANALGAMIVPIQGSEVSFSTVDMEGATARVLAGWTRHDGRAWFFKLTGPKTAVEQEKPKFVKFLQSVRF
jgi:hypothetical protein